MKTLVLANQKGGVGKSAVATLLVHYFAQHGQRVLAIDLDHQGNFSKPLRMSERAVVAACTAPVSHTLRMSGGSGMTPSSRDRISVDLCGLKASLFEQARARGVSPSGLVRDTLIDALGKTEPSSPYHVAEGVTAPMADRVRLSLRMSREEASATLAAARQAGLAPGAFVAGLVAGVPALLGGSGRDTHIAALIASSAELSTLSRDIHHLTSLLRQGNVRAAQEYRERLDTLAGDVRNHLSLASRVSAGLRPRSQRSDAPKHPVT